MVYLITFFVTQSWSWEITNILHLWGMARPMKCYQYYYTIPNDIVPEENCHVKKKKIFCYSIFYLACVAMRLNMFLLSPAFRKPDVDDSNKDCRNHTGMEIPTLPHPGVEVAVMPGMARRGRWGGRGWAWEDTGSRIQVESQDSSRVKASAGVYDESPRPGKGFGCWRATSGSYQ